MKYGRAVLYYSFLLIFLATAAVALLGITDVLTIRKEYLDSLFYALIAEIITAVIGVYVNTNWFSINKLEAVKDIEGVWWQKISIPGENAIGFVNISFTKNEQQIKLEGRAFTEKGLSWARFWSISAAYNAATDELYYFWQGDESQSDEDFSGVGLIRFTKLAADSLNLDSGTGWFTRGNIFRAEVTERKKSKYRRATEIEAEVINDGNLDLQRRLVAYVSSNWPSRCRQTSMEKLKEELMPA